MADVGKMFLQINMHREDANFQRVLWRPTPFGEVRDYLLNTVTFGTTCAPFLAIRTLKTLAEDEEANYPNITDCIDNEFYVDDLLSGGHDLEETIRKRKNIESALSSGGFHLRKWISNDLRILEDIPETDLEMETTVNLNLEQNYKSLGIKWYPLLDQFSYGIELREQEGSFTKRLVLSDIAHLYDPLGWLAPIVIVAKMFMKSLWKHDLNWDELLPSALSDDWIKYRNSLRKLMDLRIPRWINFRTMSKVEIHGFCDASLQTYTAAVYIVIGNHESVKVSLLISKTKVGPIKEVPIARLELCAAVLLANLIKRVKEVAYIKQSELYLWSDSETVLAWLKGHPTRWTVFVANRIVEIQDVVGDSIWRYVPSKENPADLATRGLGASEFIDNDLWWHGPSWLGMGPRNWPRPKDCETGEEVRKTKKNVNHIGIEETFLESLLNKFSSLTRLLRVTAYCFRFGSLKSRLSCIKGHLSAVELQQSMDFWIKYTQRKYFAPEIHALEKGDQIHTRSTLRNLNPFLDKGLLRVNGRLSNADLSFTEQQPIILGKSGHFVKLLLEQIHKATMHGHTQLMLNTVRKRYWILSARRTIKQVIHSCVRCFRANAKGSSQLMGNLPQPRVNISRPFTHTGIDYCGPIELRDRRGRGSRTYKAYIAIFICLCVKAIHIELVTDYSTQAFLAALRRFMGRRGFCGHIYTDCGTNFVGANVELNKIINASINNASESLANEGIVWHFNPPASPHFGGLWEAGVKSIKTHLKRTIGTTTLTYEEMTTVLIRIEACLNSRPLCPLSDDPSDISALTPAHFLIGDTMIAPPENDLSEVKLTHMDRWQLTQKLSQMFWIRWKTEYLARLQVRPKWIRKESQPKVEDICIVSDDKSPSYKWPLAKIVELHTGKDSFVRVVSILLNGKIYKRPITKIALLPVQQNYE